MTATRLRAWLQHTSVRLALTLFVCSVIVIYALGYPLNPNRIVETAFFYLLLQRFAPRLLAVVLALSALIVLLYHPTAALYGRPSFGIVVSLISTTSAEAWEYLQIIPLLVYIKAIVLAAFVAWVAWLCWHSPAARWSWRRTVFLVVIISIMVAHTARKPDESRDFAVRIMPVEFLADAWLIPRNYFADLKRLRDNMHEPGEWRVTNVTQAYRNYILVIGESMRSDYMSLYGYPIRNTPFLDQHAQLVMEQVMAPGANTPMSLLRSLCRSQNGGQVEVQNSLITLARTAHMQTHWLSNQGMLGKYDTSVASIAYQADHAHFLKTLGYDHGENTYDTQLLPLLQQALQTPLAEKQNRLIVLHLLGSHPNTCRRLQHPPQSYSDNHDTNCYIDSIRQTDDLLRQIGDLLEVSGQPWSMLYFSDHGLAQDKNIFEKYGRWSERNVLRHNDRYIQSYHIPFVIVHSGGQGQVRNPALRDGLHLMNGFAEWLGIHSSDLETGYDFFSATSDTDVQVLTLDGQWQPLTNLRDDPPWVPE